MATEIRVLIANWTLWVQRGSVARHQHSFPRWLFRKGVPRQWKLLLLAGSLGILEVSCGDTEPRESEPTGTTGGWPPAECNGLSSPFLDESCLGALRATCLAHTSEQSCLADGPARIGGLPEDPTIGGYNIYCGWAPVVTFSTGGRCQVESVKWRCEARLDQLLACRDPCIDPPELYYAWNAIPSDRELMKICGGPLGEWSAVGAEPGHVGTCMDNVAPPAPELCDCTTSACEALSGSAGSSGL